MIQQLTSPETATSLGITPGGHHQLQVNNGTTNPELLQSGPFVFVQGTGPSAEAAQEITQQVSAMAATVLDQRQDEVNAPGSTHIELQVVVPPTAGKAAARQPAAGGGRRGALAGLASLAAVYGFESLMTHRRRRREERERAKSLGERTPAPSPGRPPGSDPVVHGPRPPRARSTSCREPPRPARLADHSPDGRWPRGTSRTADATTILAFFVVLQFVLPLAPGHERPPAVPLAPRRWSPWGWARCGCARR